MNYRPPEILTEGLVGKVSVAKKLHSKLTEQMCVNGNVLDFGDPRRPGKRCRYQMTFSVDANRNVKLLHYFGC